MLFLQGLSLSPVRLGYCVGAVECMMNDVRLVPSYKYVVIST